VADGRVRTVLELARRSWRALGDPTSVTRRAELESFVLDHVVRRPIVFEDGRGLRYVLHPDENARAYLEHDGNYEVAETRFCERVVRAGWTVFDVGAHIGIYTLLLAQLVGEEGRVHAFEPEPENLGRLRANLALNDVATVWLVPAAAAAESGTATLHVFPPGFGACHSLGRPTVSHPFVPGQTVEPIATIEVPTVTLDEYCAERGVERIDLLKLDVEGAEVDVLRGAEQLLGDGRIGTILFEVSLPQSAALSHAPSEVFERLASLGYECFAIAADGALGRKVELAEARYGNYAATRDPTALEIG
jgi:FkbM family methyltransferase